MSSFELFVAAILAVTLLACIRELLVRNSKSR